MKVRPVGGAAAGVLAAAVMVLALRAGSDGAGGTAEAQAATTTLTTTTLPPPTTTTTAPPATTTTAPPAPPGPDLTVFSGLGTWIDVYDWSETYNRGHERVEVADVDRMADAGVQTLYIQTAKAEVPDLVLERHRVLPLIARAKERGMGVVAWYLPTFVDPAADMGKLMEATRLPGVDGLAVDIESRALRDVGERNRRLLEISGELRRHLPGVPLGAVTFPPVILDVLNPGLWPAFPWQAMAPSYDVWLPMSYQSYRLPESGWRDGYRYTAENIDRVRGWLGRGDLPVHVIGGIADETTPGDLLAMLRASSERRVLGGSLYDWRTTTPDLLALLGGFRNPARG